MATVTIGGLAIPELPASETTKVVTKVRFKWSIWSCNAAQSNITGGEYQIWVVGTNILDLLKGKASTAGPIKINLTKNPASHNNLNNPLANPADGSEPCKKILPIYPFFSDDKAFYSAMKESFDTTNTRGQLDIDIEVNKFDLVDLTQFRRRAWETTGPFEVPQRIPETPAGERDVLGIPNRIQQPRGGFANLGLFNYFEPSFWNDGKQVHATRSTVNWNHCGIKFVSQITNK